MKNIWLRNHRVRPFVLGVVLLLAAAAARAGTVSGVIHNGTNDNKVAAGVDVLLIRLQGGMQSVASTKTDAEGRYHFDNPAIGTGPMLIRAVYRGVNFHQPLTPGTATVDVTVYEPTTDPHALQIPLRLLVFQPNGDKLVVGEEYSIQNNSNPPAAYYKQDGNFEFTIPEGAEIQQVSTFGPSGMPVTQGTIDKGKGRYAIAYAFQPGQNGVRLSYQLPYGGNHAAIRESSTYDAQRVLLVAPPTMQVSSPGFNPAGTEQGFNVFSKDAVKTGAAFEVAVSGTAPPPSDAANAPEQNIGRDSSGPAATLDVAPARLGDEKWILLGGLAAIFAVGVALLFKQSAPVTATSPAAAVPPGPGPRARKQSRSEASKVSAAVAASTASSAPSASESLNAQVNSNLDSLKDVLLRLELRRQAGTITEDEYVRERGRAEQTLRDLVRG